MRVTASASSVDLDAQRSAHQLKRGHTVKPARMAVKCLALDYDGTIGPLTDSRHESRVPKRTSSLLHRIGTRIPIVVVTTKDLSFVTLRTSFAHAWSAINGLETKIGQKVQDNPDIEHRIIHVADALKYAKSHINEAGVEIEPKRDSQGRIVAFCVDWRRAEDLEEARKRAMEVAAHCRALGLTLTKCERQPFFDVYPADLDKGKALARLTRELKVKEGVMYIGDSEADNPAFKASSISVGVLHGENTKQNLACDYFVRFEDVAALLNSLLENELVFDSGFPVIRSNLKG